MFKKAEKKKSKLRLAIDGPSGSGKTEGSLKIAAAIAKEIGGRIAVIDTEHGSASLYSDRYDFDVMEIRDDYAPEKYISGIKAAEQAGYSVLIMDSISHEWEGPGGCLDLQTKLGGRYTDWAKVSPRHDKFIQAILGSNLHIIATMRTKAEYVIEKNANGKDAPKKVGTAPKQRDGMEYEFTAVFNLNQQHIASVSKDRTSLFDGKDFMLDESVGKSLIDWLENGVAELTEEDINESLDAITNTDDLNDLWATVPKSLQTKLRAKFTAKKEQIIKDLNKDQAA
jgi:energy-coupling factor transporter ATP-binding protein EcfA2